MAHIKQRRTSVNFLRFMNDAAGAFPKRELHVVLDNPNIHNNEAAKRWLRRHPHVHFPFHEIAVERAKLWLFCFRKCWLLNTFSLYERRAQISERISSVEMRQGKTPDFRVFMGNDFVLYGESKQRANFRPFTLQVQHYVSHLPSRSLSPEEHRDCLKLKRCETSGPE